MIVDAHQHVWDPSQVEYPWFGPEHAPIAREVRMAEVLPALRRAGVTGSVLVQSADDPADTAQLLAAAAAHPEVVGVVGWMPLDRPEEAAARLEERDPLVVGIRNLIHDRPDPDWLLRPEVDAGLGVLERAGLPFDLVGVLPRHLELVPILSERHPGLDIVLDHLGHPPIGAPPDSAPMRTWARLLARAAENPRVHAKVSGLYPSPPLAPAAAAETLRPIVGHALDVLGSARLMYGGDWPMSILSSGYDATWDGLRILFDELDPASRHEVVGGTAIRFYRLDRERLAGAGRSAA